MTELKEKLNLFNRPINYQFIILGLWLIGLIIIVYTTVYNDLIPDLIYRGILPTNQLPLLLIGIGIVIFGVILMISIPKESAHLAPNDSAI